MKTTIETKSGSVYELDNVKMTWARLEETGESGRLRTDGGELSSFPAIKLDEPLILLGPPMHPWTWPRIIMTTPVTRITHESTGFAKSLAAGGQRVVDQTGKSATPVATDKAMAAANSPISATSVGLMADQFNDLPSCTLCGAAMQVNEYKCLSCGNTTGLSTPAPVYRFECICGRSDACTETCVRYNQELARTDAPVLRSARIKPKAELRPRAAWMYLVPMPYMDNKP